MWNNSQEVYKINYKLVIIKQVVVQAKIRNLFEVPNDDLFG